MFFRFAVLLILASQMRGRRFTDGKSKFPQKFCTHTLLAGFKFQTTQVLVCFCIGIYKSRRKGVLVSLDKLNEIKQSNVKFRRAKPGLIVTL